MGTFNVPIEVGDLDGRRFEALDALVDTGATYLVVPRRVLLSLGVTPSERRQFTLADGREASLDVGSVMLRLDSRVYPVVAVFSEQDAHTLLGSVALETFGLGVDPLQQRLVRVNGLLMTYCR